MGLVFDVQEGPQRRASESRADVVFYGGAAGCGKSRFLIHNTAEYFDHKGLAGMIFRRTSDELRGEGSLWAESEEVYPHLGGASVESRLHWTFPAGGGIKFSHLEHEKDRLKHQGKQYSAVSFDELTHFTEAQFWYLWSRLRSPHGIRTRMRASMNPDPDAFFLDWIKPYLDERGVPDQRLSGAVRWFVRDGGRMKWFERKQDAPAHAQSFAFIPGRLEDNPALTKSDPTYRAKLLALPLIEQVRLLGGNWFMRPSAGDYFQSGWFPRLPLTAMERVAAGFKRETRVVKRWRVWDLAGTAGVGDGKHRVVGAPREQIDFERPEGEDPDFTVSWLFALLDDGRCLLEDTTRNRDTPGAIEWLMGATAERDPTGTVQVLWQDPGQAGVHQEVILRRIFKGRRVATCKTFKPELVATIASREACKGRMLLREGPWSSALTENMRELEAYPAGEHDDAVSALGLGVAYWLEQLGTLGKVHGLRADESRTPESSNAFLNRPLHEAQEASARATRTFDVKLTNRFREF